MATGFNRTQILPQNRNASYLQALFGSLNYQSFLIVDRFLLLPSRLLATEHFSVIDGISILTGINYAAHAIGKDLWAALL